MRKLLVLFLFVTSTLNAVGQCSDAGVCSLGSHLMDSVQSNSMVRASVEYSLAFGEKEYKSIYNSVRLRGSIEPMENLFINVVVPYHIIQGRQLPMESSAIEHSKGIGDIIAIIQYPLYKQNNTELALQAGMKFASGSTHNICECGEHHLPLFLQPGLGTNDVVASLNLTSAQFKATLGYQRAERNPLNNIYGLQRGDDALATIGYSYPLQDFTFNADVLLIQRLQKSTVSTILDTIVLPPFFNLGESNQTQVNLRLECAYNLSQTIKAHLFTALPFIQRKDNSDGLTRSFTIGTYLSFAF